MLSLGLQNEAERRKHEEKMDLLRYAESVAADNAAKGSVFGKFAERKVEEYAAAGKNIKPLLAQIKRGNRTTFAR